MNTSAGTRVERGQRLSKDQPCPICGGWDGLPQGRGVRCWGFLSDDGNWAHCTREEYARGLELNPGSSTYSHRLNGLCGCGVSHNASNAGSRHDHDHERAPETKRTRYHITDPFTQDLIAVHVRVDCADGSKRVWWERNGARGLGGLRVEDLPLYGVHEIVEKPSGSSVILVEGEKARDALAQHGVLAVGTVTGAGTAEAPKAPSSEVLRVVADFDVVVWPDNDDPGEAHMELTCRRLLEAGSIPRVLRWPDAPPKGDAADYFNNGGERESLEDLINRAEKFDGNSASTVEVGEEEGGETEITETVPTFPEAAWRGPFNDYRAAMRGTSEAPDSIHFASLWAAAAVKLRRRVRFYYATDLYPNPYLVTFGGTGDSKTCGMRQAFQLDLDRYVKLLRGVGSAEALADWMTQQEGAPPVAHMLFLEELGSLLIRGRWDGSTVLAFLTETFDCPPILEIPFRKKPIKVIEPTPVLFAGTTPEWFWQSMKEIDFFGGFGNRLFFLTGTPKAPIPRPAKPDAVALGEVLDALGDLSVVPPGEMELSPDAVVIWDEFYMAWKTTQFESLTAAATKRIPAYALKLAMVYAAFERTAPKITADQISAAILVGRFGVGCAQSLIQQREQCSPRSRCEEAVLRALETADLPGWKIHQRIGGRFSAEEVVRVIRALMGTGAVVEAGRTVRKEPIYGRRARRREA